MESREIEPRLLGWGVNPTADDKVERITASMRTYGWVGRPLLVEEGTDDRLHAWTGTHRSAAARAANIATVPCLVISRETSQAALDRLPDPIFSSLREALTMRSNGGGPYDDDRLRAVVRLGLREIASALEEEIQSPRG